MTDATETDRFERLARRLEPRGTLLRTWPLAGGGSVRPAALELALPGGRTRRLVVRRFGGDDPQPAANEFGLLELTRSLGLPTPTPLLLDRSGEIFPTPVLVLDYIEGRPDYAPTDLRGFVHGLAAQLARIHRVDGSGPRLTFLPRQSDRLTATLGKRPAQLDATLSEGQIREALEAAWPWPRPNPPALLHGDFWPGNVLWREGRLVGVIDWEDAGTGDPLADVAITRLDLLWIFGTEAMHDFTRRYRSLTAIDVANLPCWDLWAALRPASQLADWAAAWPELGRNDITEETMRAGHGRFVGQALEALSRL